MGMYSSFEHEDIEVKDPKGLKAFLARWNKKFPGYYETKKMYDEKSNTFSFEDWDGHKLISYWYPHTCAFLYCLAKYLKGEVYFSFENPDEGGYWVFADKKCTIYAGQMQWSSFNASEGVTEDRPSGVDNELIKLREIMLVEGI